MVLAFNTGIQETVTCRSLNSRSMYRARVLRQPSLDSEENHQNQKAGEDVVVDQGGGIFQPQKTAEFSSFVHVALTFESRKGLWNIPL